MTMNAMAYRLGLTFLILLSSLYSANARDAQALADTVKFVGRELLGRPTDKSIALILCVDRDVELYVEYGAQRGVYDKQSSLQTLRGGAPQTITIPSLLPDTRYFYRVRYRIPGTTDFLPRDEHTFQTARPQGRPFVFAIEADPHLDAATNPDMYRLTLTNIGSAAPDFLIDLGDNFMSEKLTVVTQDSITKRHLLLRSFYETACHSIPLMLVIGNHEGELGWLNNTTPDNTAVWTSNTRKLYYPNPIPDGFYTGDTTNVSFVGQRQNYYAWQWGNALFVVLDPYWYTTRKPGGSKNNWDWTLGRTQYDWFKSVLEKSQAGFKFVFAHQIVGGLDTDGRGGIEAVPFYEMGGLNADGTQGFATNRPGWPKPIHQLMVDNHVTAYLHGHDHVFVKQDLDGIVYQEVPQPGYYNFSSPEKTYSNTGLATQYGYTHGVIYSSPGYLRVTVADTAATVEYVRSYLPEHENSQRHNGDVAYSYSLRKWTPTTSVGQESALPNTIMLYQNYPNPFNGISNVGFSISKRGRVALQIYDVLGKEVATLLNETKEPGHYEVMWDSRGLTSGLYVCKLTAGSVVQTRKMMLLK
jgi:hypothetical protein